SGTPIYTMNDFLKVRDNLDGTYVLMNDIDCEGMTIPVMGADTYTPFRGVFDGQGYTISNYVAPTNQYIGLFGYNAGVIRNLNVSDFTFNVENANTAGSVYVGAIVGYNSGTIEQCSATGGSIYVCLANERYVGLIAGKSSNLITNCIAKGSVKVTQPSETTKTGVWAYAGGVAGYTSSEISNCYVNATISAFSGSRGSTISNQHYGAAGLVCGESDTNGNVINCVVLGAVERGNGYAGDIAGYSQGKITNCYKASGVSVTQDTSHRNVYATVQSTQNLSKSTFYEVSLGWNSDIWDYQTLNLGISVHPTLKQNN
ncbi:MAG: hypothetical protein IJB94_06930, partial [Clostridia bacterium]|nr:hypothetical protein [Clostridia bacterium]